jgi:topoisomerase-4 subunit A
LYKKIENVATYDKIHDTIASSLEPFHEQLSRVPIYEDRERLLNIPIRRISRFDLDKNQEEIGNFRQNLNVIEKNLKNIKKFTINYLQDLIKKYGKHFPRKTAIKTIEQIDMRAIETRIIKVGYDPVTGFVGTKVGSEQQFECTNFDKLLLIFKDGSYSVINVPEKLYVNKDSKIVYVGIADKKTVMNVVYKDSKKRLCYAKRFVVSKFIIDKAYRYFDEGMTLEYISTQPKVVLELQFVPVHKQKTSKMSFDFSKVLVKGVTALGLRMSPREVRKIVVPKASEPEPDLFSALKK